MATITATKNKINKDRGSQRRQKKRRKSYDCFVL
jgi:hypothetical protein